MTIKFMVTILSIITIILSITAQNVHATEDIWSEGTTYKLTPKDNMVTVKDYTIKAVDFPAPVRGIRTINGTVLDRPVVPFVMLELYKDMVNNTSPIYQFSLGIGDEYITADKEIRITLDSMPDSGSQDWMYEYYDPWASISVQKRGLPSLDVSISLKDVDENNDENNEDNVDENNINPGDNFNVVINIKNTGVGVLENVNFNISLDPLLKFTMVNGSRYTKISSNHILSSSAIHLDKNEERSIEISLTIPFFLEEKEYYIYANATGYDIKGILYEYNISETIKSKNPIESTIGSVTLDKMSKSTAYLKEYIYVSDSIYNPGPLQMDNIIIRDYLPDRVLFRNDFNVSQSDTEFSLNKSSLKPKESWSFYYILKPLEPGIYVIPKFTTSFSIFGREFNMSSNEAGFRVFGPKIALNKSVIYKSDTENTENIIDVIIKAKNVGNGFTTVRIYDRLPENTVLVSGKLNSTIALDPKEEKIVNYTIKADGINISSILWPPAKAIYYLDDYVFNTSSDEIVIEELPEEITSTAYKKAAEAAEAAAAARREAQIAIMTPSPSPSEIIVEEPQKKVVATIPAKTPKVTEKSTPGFGLFEIGVSLMILILLGRKKDKEIKNMKKE